MTLSVERPSPSREKSTPAGSRQPRRRGRGLSQVVAPFLVFLIVLGVWMFIRYALPEPRPRCALPPPQDVIRNGLLDPRNFNEILAALWSTTQVAIVGLLVAILIGSIVAIAMIQAQWIEWSIYPWAVVLQTIPILAIVPLIGFWF